MNQRKVGALLSYLSMGVTILANFIYIPVLLRFVSQEEYGVYQIMGSMIAYLSVMDFGLSNTIIRYYSKSVAQNDEEGQENILAISLIIYGFISILAMIVCIVGYNFIDVVYSETFTLYELEIAKKIYIILGVNIVLSIPSHVFGAVIQSNEKYIFYKGVVIIQAIMQPLVIIAVMHSVPNVILIAAVQLLFNVIVIVLNVIYCYSNLRIKIRLHKWDGKMIKEMLGFAFFVFLGTVVDQVNWRTDQMILGAVLGTSVAAVYSISSQLQMAFMNFSTAINNVFLPRISKVAAVTDDMQEMNNIFLKVGRLQLYVVLYVYGGFLVLGRDFITKYWVGEAYQEAYICAVIVMTSIIIPLSQNTAIFILQAKNKHAFRSILYTVLAVLHVLIAIIAAKHWGGVGCAAAMALTQILGNTIIMNIYYWKKIGIELKKYYKSLLQMLPILLLSVVLGKGVVNVLMDNIIGFVIVGFVYSIIYWLLVVFFAFNDYEKDMLYGRIRLRLKKS